MLEFNKQEWEGLEDRARIEKVPAAKLLEGLVSKYLSSAGDGSSASLTAAQGTDAEKPVDESALYKWYEAIGEIRYVPTNRRVILLAAHSWATLEDSLTSSLGKAADAFLYQMGCTYGRALALDYRSITDDPEDVRSYFEHLGTSAGWGRITLHGDLASDVRITIRVQNCAFCRSRNLSVSEVHSCHFLVGVSKGIADTVLNSLHYAAESKCLTKGDPYCEIVLTREENPRGQAEDWGRSSPPEP